MSQLLVCCTSVEELLDEFGMTFQVVLIGADGVVLGSDRLFAERGLRGALGIGKNFSKKIYISDDKSVVCAFAGGPNSEVIARRITTECKPSGLSDMQWRNRIEEAAAPITEYEEHIVDEVIVIRADNNSVLKVIRQRNETPNFSPVSQFICSGVGADAPLIPKLLWRPDLSVNQLKNLALVAVEYAHKEFPNLVGGGANLIALKSNGEMSEVSYSDTQVTKICAEFIQKFYRSLK
jgi:hypothetical protein